MAVVVTAEPRVVLRIENAAAARRQLEDRFGVHDEGITRSERAARRRVAKTAWTAAVTAMRKAHRANQENADRDHN